MRPARSRQGLEGVGPARVSWQKTTTSLLWRHCIWQSNLRVTTCTMGASCSRAPLQQHAASCAHETRSQHKRLSPSAMAAEVPPARAALLEAVARGRQVPTAIKVRSRRLLPQPLPQPLPPPEPAT